MDKIEAKAKLLEQKLIKSVQLTEKRKHSLKDLEEGIKLMEQETRLFEEESKKFQKIFTTIILASTCTTCGIASVLIFFLW